MKEGDRAGGFLWAVFHPRHRCVPPPPNFALHLNAVEYETGSLALQPTAHRALEALTSTRGSAWRLGPLHRASNSTFSLPLRSTSLLLHLSRATMPNQLFYHARGRKRLRGNLPSADNQSTSNLPKAHHLAHSISFPCIFASLPQFTVIGPTLAGLIGEIRDK